MARIDVYNTKGKKTGKVSLPKEIFAVEVNQSLMAQAVRVYLANQRRAQAKKKRRGEIKGSTRKIHRQKGTGRARHGDRYAPIFVGGGIAHGPTGKENFKLKMPKKMRRRALFSALTNRLKEKAIIIIDGLVKIDPKTKEMIKIMENLKMAVKNGKLKEKVSLVLDKPTENVSRAARNIVGLKLTQASLLNTYVVLNAGKLIVTKESIKKLKETFLP